MIGRAALTAAARPFLGWIVAVLVLAAVAGIAVVHHKGVESGKAQQLSDDNAALTNLAKIITDKNAALQAADEALRSAGAAIRAIQAETKRRAAELAAAEARAKQAGEVAKAAREQLRRRQAEYADREARARARPGCAAVLDLDVGAMLRKECGL